MMVMYLAGTVAGCTKEEVTSFFAAESQCFLGCSICMLAAKKDDISHSAENHCLPTSTASLLSLLLELEPEPWQGRCRVFSSAQDSLLPSYASAQRLYQLHPQY